MKYDETFGAIFSPKDIRDYQGVCCATQNDFPTDFELHMPPVKCQGRVGSCVAHAIATTIEYYNKKQLNMKDEMSVGYIYGNRENSLYKDKGMIVRDALGATCMYGDVKWSDFPMHCETPDIINEFQEKKDELYTLGTPYRFTSYFRVSSADDIKACLMDGQPVIFAMKWYTDVAVKNGVMVSSLDESKSNGSHCMVIYGWDEKGWKIQNSWGTLWGKWGRAILPYDMPIREAWGIVDSYAENNTHITIRKPFSSVIGKVVAKIINFVIQLIGGLK